MMIYVRAAVKSAASELSHAIDKSAIRKGASRDQDDRTPSRAIFAFLDKLAAWPDGINELQRRAAFVEESCGKGSSYEQCRQQVLPRLGRESKDQQVKMITDSLIASPENPVQLAELDQVSRRIEVLISPEQDQGVCDLLAEWLGACVATQRQADGLSADGCWLLAQHLREQREEPHNGMGAVTALTRSALGSGNLAQIQSAVASLLIPIDRLASDPPATQRRVKRGRPPRSSGPPQMDESLVSNWERARESGVAKKDFAKDRGMTVQELDRVVDRVKKQGKRSPKKS